MPARYVIYDDAVHAGTATNHICIFTCSGDPLPMRFDGRYLVRNDRVTRVTTVAE